ncbi:hypothetical protein ACIQMP_07735 [Streptomyces sp. NPDC091385]|uniref:hypothetical protein n=1 Tax=Streptomyces sp. NPDC091385 TaxID=3365997 RepID=UPI003810FDAF
MTKDKKRKRAVREAALTTGRRYAAQARTMAAVQRAAEFPLAALLAECVAREPAVVEWDFPAEFAPEVFESSLLGTAVPYGIGDAARRKPVPGGAQRDADRRIGGALV